jgi:hypothetical protein
MRIRNDRRGIGDGWRRLLADRQGAIAVEGAFAITILLVMLLPLIDFGGYIGLRLELKQALRAGGQFALHDYTATSSIENVIQTATNTTSTVTVTFDPSSSYCLCQNGTTVPCPGDSGYAICASEVMPPGRYLSFSATSTYDPYFPFLPGFASNMTVKEELTMRVR